jgi:hypothetical protein
MWLAIIGMAVATLGWLLAVLGAAEMDVGKALGDVGGWFGLGGNTDNTLWYIRLSGDAGKPGSYELKLQDLLMMVGGTLLLWAGLRSKNHRSLLAILGIVSIAGGVSGVAFGWDGNV